MGSSRRVRASDLEVGMVVLLSDHCGRLTDLTYGFGWVGVSWADHAFGFMENEEVEIVSLPGIHQDLLDVLRELA